MEQRYYAVTEAARVLGVKPRTVLAYIKAGKLHAMKPGKMWIIPESSLDAFISQGDLDKSITRAEPVTKAEADVLGDFRDLEPKARKEILSDAKDAPPAPGYRMEPVTDDEADFLGRIRVLPEEARTELLIRMKTLKLDEDQQPKA